MRSIVTVNPFQCRMWGLHDRLDEYITEESCQAELASFSKHGQILPALGRPLRADPTHKVELIYGARRLFIARHLNVPLLVELRCLTDMEAIIAMDIENTQRQSLSPYERGSSYARWLQSGYFRSQDDIAHALKISTSQVSRLLKMARLPRVVVDAFGSPGEICEAWALELVSILDNPIKGPQMLERARTLSESGRPLPTREVFQKLVGAAARKVRRFKHDEIVRDRAGTELFRITHRADSTVVLLPVDRTSAYQLDSVRQTIANIFAGIL